MAGEPALSNAARNATQAIMNIQGLGPLIDWVVPYEKDRIQISGLATFLPAFLSILLPLLILGLLTRQKGTTLIRRGLTPIMAALCLRGTCAYRWMPVEERRLNYQLTLLGYSLVLKCIEWGWASKGRRLLTEVAPNVPKDEKVRAEQAKLTGVDFILYRLRDWWYLMSNLRGIGWDFGTGTGLKLPVVYKNEKVKQVWVTQTLTDIVRRYLILDVLGSFVFLQTWVPAVATHAGGSIWSPDLPVWKRFLVGTAVHMGICESIKEFGHLVYDVNSVICVVFLGHETTAWPPLFGNAWKSTSFGHYWGTQWHQVLRQTFLIFLGYPMGAVFGVIGMVIGTFLASGLLHAWAFYGCGGYIDNAVTWAFTAQGLGLIAERAYYKASGKKVTGPVGHFFVMMGIVLGGQHCTDAWARQGIVGNLIVPAEASVVQNYIWPWIQNVVPALAAK